MHEEAKIEPLNYEIHRQAEKTFNKMTTLEIQDFSSIIENYEETKTHNWFKKIKNIIQKGPPERIYTSQTT